MCLLIVTVCLQPALPRYVPRQLQQKPIRPPHGNVRMCKCSEGDNQGAVTQEQEGPNLNR